MHPNQKSYLTNYHNWYLIDSVEEIVIYQKKEFYRLLPFKWEIAQCTISFGYFKFHLIGKKWY